MFVATGRDPVGFSRLVYAVCGIANWGDRRDRRV